MPTVLREGGLRFMIYVDDHPPPHVHVLGNGEAKIEIGGDGAPPRMVYAEHMSGNVQRRALNAVADNQAMLARRWMDIHDRME